MIIIIVLINATPPIHRLQTNDKIIERHSTLMYNLTVRAIAQPHNYRFGCTSLLLMPLPHARDDIELKTNIKIIPLQSIIGLLKVRTKIKLCLAEQHKKTNKKKIVIIIIIKSKIVIIIIVLINATPPIHRLQTNDKIIERHSTLMYNLTVRAIAQPHHYQSGCT